MITLLGFKTKFKSFMNINAFSTLDHVVLDFAKRTIELHGDDGEVVLESCTWDKKGLQQFENMVNFCQEVIPAEQRIYKL
jgi:hypothetical protein